MYPTMIAGNINLTRFNNLDLVPAQLGERIFNEHAKRAALGRLFLFAPGAHADQAEDQRDADQEANDRDDDDFADAEKEHAASNSR